MANMKKKNEICCSRGSQCGSFFVYIINYLPLRRRSQKRDERAVAFEGVGSADSLGVQTLFGSADDQKLHVLQSNNTEPL